MGKGIIKTTGAQSTGNSTVSITITTPSGGTQGPSGVPQPTGNGQVLTGQIQDLRDPSLPLIDFSQPFGIELGLALNMKVNYQTAIVNGKELAVSVRLLEKGQIMTINPTDDGGTLIDNATGATIPFVMLGCTEFGLVAAQGTTKGTMVHFETVISPRSAQPTAVALEII